MQTSVLASLWRILSGEQLKIGDEKLENLFYMIEVLVKELGDPLSVIMMEYPWLFKLFNSIGILQTIVYNRTLVNFTENVLTTHKQRHIDGKNNISFLFVFRRNL